MATTDLASLLAAIPIAEDGKLITRDYHNSLRAALLALAGQSVPATAPAQAKAGEIVLVPAFVNGANDKVGRWALQDGVASADERGASGILPFNLRDTETLAKITLTGHADAAELFKRGAAELAYVVQSVKDPSLQAATSLDDAEIKSGAGGDFAVAINAKSLDSGKVGDIFRSGKTALQYLKVTIPQGAGTVQIYSVVLTLAK
ncbi:hypothetical protein ABWL39_08750 [Chitinivorax sp. PXF-14]|uniref:hypothetical protein n=1 Tax=Chitinivorax sp. PXF-14 TaxID=3230488 RepID=UPI003464EBD5